METGRNYSSISYICHKTKLPCDTCDSSTEGLFSTKNSHLNKSIKNYLYFQERNDEDLTINSIFGSAKATQEADNVLIIQDKRLVSIKGKKYLQIAKNRFSGDLGVMILNFDRDAKSYASKK